MPGMKVEAETKSVIWAVDPFESNVGPPSAIVRELLEWTHRARLRLIPVHVVSLAEKRLEAGEVLQMDEIESALQRYFHSYPQRNGWQSPRVLIDEQSSRAGIVKSLLKYAQSENADWIVVSSHGRSGVERLVLGSFAEILLRDSPWPVLFLPRRAHSAPASEHRRALFPSDFSAPAREAFNRFLKQASAQRFEVLLFHMLTYPVPPVDVSMMGMTPALPENFLAEQMNWAQRMGEEWVASAARAGVRARFVLKSSEATVLSARVVLDVAEKEQVRLIAMPSVGGPLHHLMTGSVAREVFRAGLYPVWLYGPSCLGGKRRKAA